ncbi:alpha/beta hydrolase [Allobranchiibius sp. GilTou38]|uniref:alpha/beta fold hydrolase n=1 Tax=Allobranchiibius sp. GilTou38 TaxID=2815210 RepID=UPI001AA1275C|nr:alpha/beta hydrolase [Allobranchiibius sp. GilTou38]MBO1765455.1 alpha/beta hydrolase [Allobranchiibius sp. GilTou38]
MRRTGESILASAAVGLLASAVGLQRWRRVSADRQDAGARVLHLSRGPVEVRDSSVPAGGRRTADEPAVVVVHGTPGGYDLAQVTASGLGLDDRRVVSVSRPGYLRTPLDSGPTPEEQADLFAEVLDALGIETAVVIAVSGGGPAAVQFALRHASRCARLVLIESLVQTFTEHEMYASLQPLARVGKWLGERLAQVDAVIGGYLLVTPRSDPGRAVAAAAVRFDRRKAGYAADMRLFEDVPDYPFEQISSPTLVIHGTADVDVPFAQAQTAADRIPGAQLVAVPGADHLGLWRHEVVGQRVRAFLAD